MYLLATGLMVFSINANAGNGTGPSLEQFANNCLSNHSAPFIGINTKWDLCCIVANATDETGSESKVFVGGSAETISLAVNKNFALATCQVKLPDGFTDTFDLDSGRNQVEGCHIGGAGKSISASSGGFTIDTEEGFVSANCKAEIE